MSFSDDKEKYLDALYKPDLSKKGNVDERIASLLNTINDLDEYVTTSSCSGRMVLITIPPSGTKHECNWPLVSHTVVSSVEGFWEILLETASKTEEKVWFKMEAAILHVQCKTLEAAQQIITDAKHVGFKRSGIFVTKPERYIVEIMGTEKIETLVAKEGKVLIDKQYLSILIDEGNKRLNKTHAKIDAFEKLLQEKYTT